MHIGSLSIFGYRCFNKQFDISFSKGLNVIVGENGAGKTAVIDALRLQFSEDEYSRLPVQESDFHRPFESPGDISKKIEIKSIFQELNSSEEVSFLPWVTKPHEMSLTMQVDCRTTNRGSYRKRVWGGSSSASIFEWELMDTFDCIYLPPLRDAESRLKEGKGSRLARLLKTLGKSAVEKSREEGKLCSLEEKVKTFNQKLANDKEEVIYQANGLIRKGLSEAIGEVFGQDTCIQFSEPTFNRIVENLRLLFFPGIQNQTEADHFRDLHENSLGYNNLLYLATVLAELDVTQGNEDVFKLLLIEEPEAHLHPQMQIRLLKYLNKTAREKNIQVIVTTHSTVLASAVPLDSIIHISNTASESFEAVTLKNCGMSDDSKDFINRWMDATKSTLLFSKGVIFVEGIAEAILLPEFAKTVLKEYNKKSKTRLPNSLEDAGVSVVNMNGIYFKHFMQMFCNLNGENAKTVKLRCSGITDKDPSKDSKPTPENLIKGENPALELLDKINASENCRLFVGKLKTFEYDLAFESENMKTMFTVLERVWPTEGPIKKDAQEYAGLCWIKEDYEAYAEAASKLLGWIENSNVGKGYYSQCLADEIVKVDDFAVPQYIHNAVIWACGGEVNGQG